MKEVISSLRTTFREEMHTKLDVIKANGKQIEEGLTTFDLSVTSVIHALTAEGTKINNEFPGPPCISRMVLIRTEP
jgi:hypothetical protein